MNKTKKILSIILLTLLIISTVFTLCKKFGFCASSESTSFTKYPLPYGKDYYGIKFPDIDAVISKCSQSLVSPVGDYSGYAYFYSPHGTSGWINLIVILYSTEDRVVLDQGNDTIDLTSRFDFTSNIVNWQWRGYQYGCISVAWNPSTETFDPNSGPSFPSFSNPLVSDFLWASPSGNSFVLPSEIPNYYPIFSYGIMANNNGGAIFGFSDMVDIVSGVVTSAGNMVQIQHNLTQSSTLYDFFVNLFSWISGIITQIYNSIVWLYNNFVSFFKPVFDSIINFIKWYIDKFTVFGLMLDILQWLKNYFDNGGTLSALLTCIVGILTGLPSAIYNQFVSWLNSYFTNLLSTLNTWIQNIYPNLPDPIKNFFRLVNEIYNHGLKNGEFDFATCLEYYFGFDSTRAFNDFSSNKYGLFVLDVKSFFTDLITSFTGVTASDRVFFTISIGNYLDNTISGSRFGITIPDITIDFSWYAQIRDTFLPYFMAFLFVSVLWLFFKRLPDILRGVAGGESSFVDNLPEHAPTRDGFFTRGVSTNQPSLDKSPLSGSASKSNQGGVRSGDSQFWF